jgi:hypothetical protein
VRVGGLPCAVVSLSASALACVSPPGTGAEASVSLAQTGARCRTHVHHVASVGFAAPVVGAVWPRAVNDRWAVGVVVTVHGAGFGVPPKSVVIQSTLYFF